MCPRFLKDQYIHKCFLLIYSTTFLFVSFLEQKSTIQQRKEKLSSELKMCYMGKVFKGRAALPFKCQI